MSEYITVGAIYCIQKKEENNYYMKKVFLKLTHHGGTDGQLPSISLQAAVQRDKHGSHKQQRKRRQRIPLAAMRVKG